MSEGLLLDKKTEKVYLGDWLYNAGIVGFIRIINNGGDKNKISDFVKVNDNSIEFDRDKLEGFSEKFFETAIKQYGRYDRLVEDLPNFVKEINDFNGELSNNLKRLVDIADTVKRRLNFTLLKEKLKDNYIALPNKKAVEDNPQIVLDTIKEVLDILKNDYKDFREADTKIYLSRFFGKNNSESKGKLNTFKKYFEESIVNNTNKPATKGRGKKKIEFQCVNCERIAKKDVITDTRIGTFAGIGSVNEAWNFGPYLRLCEICELIYFCIFAGFTDVSRGKEKLYYFVNHDISIQDLIDDNHILQSVLSKGAKDNILFDYFTEYLHIQKEKSKHTLKNISFIELDNPNGIMPKVYSLNLDKTKAMFIHNYHDKFNKLAKAYYKVKDSSKNILRELVEHFLLNSLSYNQIYWLAKIYMTVAEGKSDYYKAYFNTYHIQNYMLIIALYNKIILQGESSMADFEKSVWFIYNKGKELMIKLRQNQAENKISTIVLSLLNALRVGDVNKFMEVIVRVYMAYGLDIPSTFVEGLTNKDSFYAYGYSFVNGLLAKEKTNKEASNV